ncbi:MAG: DUF192 domain-containing protein [Actinomycetota bacterium]
MDRSRILVLALLVGAASLAACSHAGSRSAEARIATAAGTVSLRVTVADSAAARERGLQGVERLDPDAGMAFLFGRPSRAGFWMRDTLVPLSIAFWGRDGRILALRDMTPCPGRRCPTYRPGRPFVGALEANRGFFARHDVAVGDRVVIVGG